MSKDYKNYYYNNKYEKYDDDDYKKNIRFNNKHYYKNYYYKDKKYDERNFYIEKREKFFDKNRKNSYDYSYNSKDNNNKKYYNKHYHSRSRSSNSRSFKSFSSYSKSKSNSNSKSNSTIKNEIENNYFYNKENDNKNIKINNIINNNNININNNLIDNNNNLIDNNIINNNNNTINNNLNNIYNNPLQNFQYPLTYPFPQNSQSYLTQPNFLTFPQISNYYPSENLNNSLKEPSNTLLISNLGADINKEILDDIFREKCIELQTSVPEDIRLIESLGIAYVIFPSIPVCTLVYECLKGKILINGNYYYLNFTPNLTNNNFSGNPHDSVTYVTHINKANNFQTSMETTVHEDWYCEYCDCKNFSRRTLCFKCKKPKTINCRIAPVIKQKTTVVGENGAIPPSTSIIVKGEVIKTSNEAEVKIFI